MQLTKTYEVYEKPIKYRNLLHQHFDETQKIF